MKPAATSVKWKCLST